MQSTYSDSGYNIYMLIMCIYFQENILTRYTDRYLKLHIVSVKSLSNHILKRKTKRASLRKIWTYSDNLHLCAYFFLSPTDVLYINSFIAESLPFFTPCIWRIIVLMI